MFLGIVLACSAAADEGPTEEVAGIWSVPLMPGLTEIEEETIVFDKPEGRIIMAVAEGCIGEDRAFTFYETALAEIGWVPATTTFRLLEFTRADERLEIRFEGFERGAVPEAQNAEDFQRHEENLARCSPSVRVYFRLSPI